MADPRDTGDLSEVAPDLRHDRDPVPGEAGYADHVALGDDGDDDTAGLADLEDGDVVDEEVLQ